MGQAGKQRSHPPSCAWPLPLWVHLLLAMLCSKVGVQAPGTVPLAVTIPPVLGEPGGMMGVPTRHH